MCAMAILILTEGGNTRRFNLRTGKLSPRSNLTLPNPPLPTTLSNHHPP